jgi:hypothetical protein
MARFGRVEMVSEPPALSSDDSLPSLETSPYPETDKEDHDIFDVDTQLRSFSMTVRDVRSALVQSSKSTESLNDQLRSFYDRNMGRPVSEVLFCDLLRTLGEFVPVPRSLKGLQSKRRPGCLQLKNGFKVTAVCGKCFIFRFDDDDVSIFNGYTCLTCSHTKLKCGNARCGATCVRVGKAAIRLTCDACGVGPTMTRTKSSYSICTIRDLLRMIYSDASNALDLLEPFKETQVFCVEGIISQ